jgi:hypothetical protein
MEVKKGEGAARISEEWVRQRSQGLGGWLSAPPADMRGVSDPGRNLDKNYSLDWRPRYEQGIC